MKRYLGGVIGDPIAHSLSPALFQLLKEWKVTPPDFAYYPWRVRSEGTELIGMSDFLRSHPYLGINVTIPHKEKVIPILDEISPEAKKVGAVNVITVDERAKLKGWNTDIWGLEQSLRDWGVGVSSAVVLGAGGAARAVGYVLGMKGLKQVFIVNRGSERAESLCQSLSQPFPQTHFSPSYPQDDGPWFFINTLPSQAGDSSNHILKSAGENSLAFDLNYRPYHSQFLLEAERRGMKIQNGLPMLIWQALASADLFFADEGTQIKAREDLRLSLEENLKKFY